MQDSYSIYPSFGLLTGDLEPASGRLILRTRDNLPEYSRFPGADALRWLPDAGGAPAS